MVDSSSSNRASSSRPVVVAPSRADSLPMAMATFGRNRQPVFPRTLRLIDVISLVAQPLPTRRGKPARRLYNQEKHGDSSRHYPMIPRIRRDPRGHSSNPTILISSLAPRCRRRSFGWNRHHSRSLPNKTGIRDRQPGVQRSESSFACFISVHFKAYGRPRQCLFPSTITARTIQPHSGRIRHLSAFPCRFQ